MENKYTLIHAYDKVVRRGLVKPLTCSCGETLTIEPNAGTDMDAEPNFRCYTCDSKTTLGLDAWADVRAVVMEHNVDKSETKD